MNPTTIGSIQLIATIDTSQYKKGAKDINNANEGMEGSTKKSDSGFARLAKRGVKVATAGILGLGAAITAMSIRGGFTRALNIEDAQAKLRGLGHDADSVSIIMENALSSVKGTAFGLDSAATTAANAVASGVKPGQQLEQVLKTVANSASLAGADMSELGSIFNKVAASNKVQMDVINQLQDRGIPVLQFLSKELGKSAEDTAKLASAGKINFATFEKAMREGVGDAALEMGNTTRGSLANMQAAFSRAGAVIAEKVLPHLRDSIQGITRWVDGVSKAIPGIIDTIVDHFSRLRDATSGLFDNAEGGDYKSLGEAIGGGIANGLNNAFKAISIGMDTIKGWFGGINWGELGMTIGRQSVAFLLGFLIGLSDFDLGAAWRVIADNWFVALIGVLSILFAPARLIKPIGTLLKKLPFASTFIKFVITPIRNLGKPVRDAIADLFSGLGGRIGGVLKNIGNVIRTLGYIIVSPFRIIINGIADQIRMLPLTFSIMLKSIKGLFDNFVGLVKGVFSGLFNAVTAIMRPLTEFFGNLFRGIWNQISGVFNGAGNWFGAKFLEARILIEQMFGGIVNWFIGKWGAIMNIFSGVANFFGSVFQRALNRITGIFGGLRNWFANLWNGIVSLFGNVGTRVGNAIGNSFKSVINSVLRGAVNIINGFLRAINSAVGAVNKIPGVNIGKLGEIAVPQLADGGIITAPTLAMVGEGNESEAVLPLSKLDKMLDRAASQGREDTAQQTPLVVNLRHSPAVMRQAALDTIELVNQVYRSRGQQEIGVKI